MGDSKKEILAIIPARSGSKGIKLKNIKPLCGKPLIAYTIEAALAAKQLSRVVVSTDSEEIAGIAREFGAEVPFLRPKSIAGSSSLLDSCLEHMITGLRDQQGYTADAVVTLYCTSPFRTPSTINFLAQKLVEGHKAVITAKRIAPHLCSFFHFDASPSPSKALRLSPSGGIDYYRAYGVFSGHSLKKAPFGTYIHYIDDPCMLVDIDTEEDLKLSEYIIHNNLFNFS